MQAGLEEGTDRETVQRLTGVPVAHFTEEGYRLNTPASPHFSAELDGVGIDVDALQPPAVEGPLVIEGAGGLLVPLTRRFLTIDIFKRWDLPVILCARTALGTINHSLLSVEALRAREIEIHGIAFIGDENVDSERTIIEFSGVRRLGRLPRLEALNSDTLATAFAENFDLKDFVTL